MKHLPFLIFQLFTLQSFSQFWQQVSDFPSTERDDGTCFVIGSKAYCGTGLQPWFVSGRDMFSFDMNTDSWDTIPALPAGNERQYANGFSDGIKGFISGGLNGSYLNDLWIYDPVTDTWSAGTPMPAAGRMGSACFVINGIAYIIGGRTSSSLSIAEVWAYDISNGSWTQKNDLPFGARWRASGAAHNNKGYLLFGKNENGRFCKELLEYNPLTDSWIIISNFPDLGRVYSSINVLSGDLLIAGGLDTLGNSYNELWRINPDSLTWQQLQSIPAAGRRGGMSFASSSALYYTTGIDQSNTRLRETWKAENPTSIKEIKENTTISCYPNPADDGCYLSIEPAENIPGLLEIIDHSGNLFKRILIRENIISIPTAELSNGLYLLRIQSGNELHNLKMVVVH
jgi:N-acetylneuraminic acid mutarotase